MFVGVHRYYKGLHIAIEAVQKTDVNLVFAGVNGMEKDLRKKCKNLSLNNIHFLGKISDEDKWTIIDLCEGFIFPSHLRSEAFGIALLEAARAGKPMISCEIATGTSFVNLDGITGIVTRPGNVLDFKEAVTKLWENKKLRVLMGRNARTRTMKYFDVTDKAKEYKSLYENLVSRQD